MAGHGGVNTEGTETPASRGTKDTEFLNTESTETPASRGTKDTESLGHAGMAQTGIFLGGGI